MYYPTDRITHTTAFVIPVEEHWLERENNKVATVQNEMAQMNCNHLIINTYNEITKVWCFYFWRHTNTHTHSLTYTHTCTFTHIYKHTHTHTFTKTHTHMRHIHSHTNSQTLIHAHTLTHTYTHTCYSFQSAARLLLCSSSHRLENTYHGICSTSRGALAGTRNSAMCY